MIKHSAKADIPLLTSRITALEQLLEVYEDTVIKLTDKLYEKIAEHKRAEEDIRRLNETLEQNVEQLLEAQEELVLKKKLAILGQFSGSVGHELRNPLGVMNNAVYFLKTVLADADESIKEY
jgi:C4-dicarboxylate-specific signal transduction histidine kinase